MRRNDRHDIDWRELKLIRVGHYLWAMHKKERGKSGNVSERQALWETLQQVWERKRELREELRAERQVKAALLRERFRPELKFSNLPLSKGGAR